MRIRNQGSDLFGIQEICVGYANTQDIGIRAAFFHFSCLFRRKKLIEAKDKCVEE